MTTGETKTTDGSRFGRLGSLGYGGKLGLVTALGALLRLALLARQSLGVDEDFTAAVLARPFDRMLDAVAHDSAPPLFYALEWPFARVLPGAAGIRVVAVLAGIAMIPLLAALARRAAGDAAGLWAAAFAAVLPATVLAAENGRMYSLAGTLVVAATLLLWRAVDAPRGHFTDRVGFGLCAAAAVWTDYFAAVAIAAILVAAVWLRPPRLALLRVWVVGAAACGSIAAWLIAAPAQLGHAGRGFWVPPLSPTSVAGTFGQLFAGPPIDAGVPGREWLIGLQVGAVAAGVAALVAAAVAIRGAAPERRHRAAFLLISCGGVAALALVAIVRPVFEARYAFVMWLPLFALAGLGLAAMPRRAAGLLVAVALVPSIAAGGVATTHPETTAFIPDVESNLGPHDLVAADPNHYLALLAEGDSRLLDRLHVVSAGEVPWYFGTAAYPPGATIATPPGDVAANAGTIYWIADPGAATPPLPGGYVESSRRCLVRVCLTTFRPVEG